MDLEVILVNVSELKPMNQTDIVAHHNMEVRMRQNRLDKALQMLLELKEHYDSTQADQFVQEFGWDMVNWMGELSKYWNDDENMRQWTDEMFQPHEKESAHEVSIVDMMCAGSSFGMMAAWDMARASGRPWTK